MAAKLEDSLDLLVVEDIKLLFEEKRIALQLMRTGIFIIIAQLVIFCFLIVLSKYYVMLEVLHLVAPFYIINIGLLGLGTYLIVHSFLRIRNYDRNIFQLKKKFHRIGDLL